MMDRCTTVRRRHYVLSIALDGLAGSLHKAVAANRVMQEAHP